MPEKYFKNSVWLQVFSTLCMLALLNAPGHAQYLSPRLTSTAGTSSNNTMGTLEWAIGEPFVITLQAESLLLSQGFFQPVLPFNVTLEVTGTACSNDTSLGIDLAVTGGIAPYTFIWSNGATTEDLTNITPGTYSVTLSDASGNTLQRTITTASNDNFENALQLTDLQSWCSDLALFCNIGATPDQPATDGSCGGDEVERNVWFSFVATTPKIEVLLRTGDEEGSIGFPEMSLWNANLSTELACTSGENKEDIALISTQLRPGETYYLAVDNMSSGNNANSGTFSLCISDDLSNDFFEGALDLTDQLVSASGEWCSSAEGFNNLTATPDKTDLKPDCWGPRVGKNLWFKFTAQEESAIITLNPFDGPSGIEFARMAVWNEDLSQLLACDRSAQGGTVLLEIPNTAPGEVYLIEIDSRTQGNNDNAGTFELCIANSEHTVVTDLPALELSGTEFKVFPNPGSNEVTVEFSLPSTKVIIELFDFTGQKLEVKRNIPFTPGSGKRTSRFNMAPYGQGQYLIRITDPQKGHFTKRVIVER